MNSRQTSWTRQIELVDPKFRTEPIAVYEWPGGRRHYERQNEPYRNPRDTSVVEPKTGASKQ